MPNITEKNNVDEDGDCQSCSFPDMCRPHSEYQKDDMRSSYSEPRDLNTKSFNKCLYILTRTHSMQVFEKIPFVKPQNNT